MQAPDESVHSAGGSQVGKVSSVVPWCRLILSLAEWLSSNFLHFYWNFSLFPGVLDYCTVLSLVYVISHSLTAFFFNQLGQSHTAMLHKTGSWHTGSWAMGCPHPGHGVNMSLISG